MKLDTFIVESVADLEEFRKWWLHNHTNNPDSFPIEMTNGNWEDQYVIWNSGTCKGDT